MTDFYVVERGFFLEPLDKFRPISLLEIPAGPTRRFSCPTPYSEGHVPENISTGVITSLLKANITLSLHPAFSITQGKKTTPAHPAQISRPPTVHLKIPLNIQPKSC